MIRNRHIMIDIIDHMNRDCIPATKVVKVMLAGSLSPASFLARIEMKKSAFSSNPVRLTVKSFTDSVMF